MSKKKPLANRRFTPILDPNLQLLCPSDDTILCLIEETYSEVTLRYLNSKTGKKDLTLTNEQLQRNLRTEIFKPINE